MARRGILKAMTSGAGEPDPAREADFSRHSGLSGMRSTLKDLTSRAVQEIDPALIDDSPHSDRISLGDEDLSALAKNIETYGQRIPALVRPAATPGRYVIVYGRRRLAAARAAGVALKAFVQPLSEEDAILAQGQENSYRSDPSFIERALFARDLEKAGHDSDLVRAALDLSRSSLSHMRAVTEVFSAENILKLGKAPAFGWKRWYGLARMIAEHGLDPDDLLAEPFDAGMTSDARMQVFQSRIEAELAKLQPSPSPAGPTLVHDESGNAIGNIHVTRNAARITINSNEQAEFVSWLKEHGSEALREIHARWRISSREE